MSGPLAGKTALITGGSKGIGAATSLILAKSGANVAINYSSDSSAAEDLAKQIGPEKSLLIQGDAGSIPDIERMVSETVNRFGKIDIVIPCAALLLMKTLEATTEADFDKSFHLNVKGPYFLCQVSRLQTPAQPLSQANVPEESSAPYARRLSHRPHLHHPMHRHHRPGALPPLQLHQRRRGADDARHVQGACAQGHRRQRRGPRPHGHGPLLQGQDGANVEDDRGIQSHGSHREAGGDRGGDCLVEQWLEFMDQRSDSARQWRHGLGTWRSDVGGGWRWFVG